MFVFIKPSYPIPYALKIKRKFHRAIVPENAPHRKTHKSIETNVKRPAVKSLALLAFTILPTAHCSTVLVIYILEGGGKGRRFNLKEVCRAIVKRFHQ